MPSKALAKVKRSDAPITAADSKMAEHMLRGKFSDAKKRGNMAAYEVCIDTATALKDYGALAAIYGNMGLFYLNLEQFQQATPNFELAVEWAQQMARSYEAQLKEAYWLGRLAWTRKREGMSEAAITTGFKALDVARGNRDERGESQALTTIGATYENLGDYDDALQKYKEALTVAHTSGDNRMKFDNLQYIGCHHSHICYDHSSALPIWEAALVVAQELDCSMSAVHVWMEISICLRNLAEKVRRQIKGLGVKEAERQYEAGVKQAVRAFEQARDIRQENEALLKPANLKFRVLWDDLDNLLDYGVEPRVLELPPVETEEEKAAKLVLNNIKALANSHPSNVCLRAFDPVYFESLTAESQHRLLQLMNDGITQPSSSRVGCFAGEPEDYERYRPFFTAVVQAFHGIGPDAVYTNEWSLSGIDGLPEDRKLDLDRLGFNFETFMRVWVGRNLSGLPLPPAMEAKDRSLLESTMLATFEALIEMEEYGGRYVSLTPDHPNSITEADRAELERAGVLFSDVTQQPELVLAGVASDWPIGRGCYISGDEELVIWVGEEEHLRITCKRTGKSLNKVFEKLHTVLALPNASAAAHRHYTTSSTVRFCISLGLYPAGDQDTD
jgi:tetratricopeptide (TPR) repeat protein